MKTLNIRWRSIALVPLVALAILSIGSRTGVVPAQNKEVREAANDVGIIIQGGIVVQGGITQGQSIRFNNTWISGQGAPGPENAFQLTVFDQSGNVVALHVFSNYQIGGHSIQSSFFDLNAAQLPASAFDNTGRAQLTGFVNSIDPNNPNKPPNPTCGFVASGEIFNNNTGGTLAHIAGAPLSNCR